MAFLTVIRRFTMRPKETFAVVALVVFVVVVGYSYWQYQRVDTLKVEKRIAEAALDSALQVAEQERQSSAVDISTVTNYITTRDQLHTEQTSRTQEFITGYLDLLELREESDVATTEPSPTPTTHSSSVPTTTIPRPTPVQQSHDRSRVSYLVDGMWDNYCHADPTHVHCSP